MGPPADGSKNILHGGGVVGGTQYSTAAALSPAGKDSVQSKAYRTYRLPPVLRPLPVESPVLWHIPYRHN